MSKNHSFELEKLKEKENGGKGRKKNPSICYYISKIGREEDIGNKKAVHRKNHISADF